MQGNDNIIDIFQRYVGEVAPTTFVRWSMVSAIAAAMGSRTYLQTQRGQTIYNLRPNLYVLLIGPQACGKSAVMATVQKLLLETDYAETTASKRPKDTAKFQVFAGSINGKALINQMQPKFNRPWTNQMYLIMDELGTDMGTNREMADLSVKQWTKMYFLPAPYQEYTRTSGLHELEEGYSLNLFLGTTREWLVQYMPQQAGEGGAFRRICSLYTNDHMLSRIDETIDPEHVTMHDYLVSRLNDVGTLEGEFGWESDAKEHQLKWWGDRLDNPPPPEATDTEWGYFQSHLDWLLKLSMVHSAAETSNMMIRKRDVVFAERALKQTFDPSGWLRGTDRLGEMADRLKAAIQRAPNGMARSEFAIFCNKHRVTTNALEPYLDTWKESGNLEIKVEKTAGRQRIVYVWRET